MSTPKERQWRFLADDSMYEWCEEVARTMVNLFGIDVEEAVEKINAFWGGLDFRGTMDVHLHETEEYWARVFFYDGDPPGDPRAP